MSDIIERLRAAEIVLGIRWDHHDAIEQQDREKISKAAGEAADEIERLRRELRIAEAVIISKRAMLRSANEKYYYCLSRLDAHAVVND